ALQVDAAGQTPVAPEAERRRGGRLQAVVGGRDRGGATADDRVPGRDGGPGAARLVLPGHQAARRGDRRARRPSGGDGASVVDPPGAGSRSAGGGVRLIRGRPGGGAKE